MTTAVPAGGFHLAVRRCGEAMRVRPARDGGKVKRYKYSALVKLSPPGGTDTPLPETDGRVVVRARHHDTRSSKIFSAVISGMQDRPVRADHSIQLTLTVLGDDVFDYLEAGDTFTLWRGHDIGQGVISRRLSWWADAP